MTVSRKTRPGGRSAKIRKAVQTAATAELQEKGYDGLSHRSIAARAGVDATTVYRRWPTRSDLIMGLLLDATDDEIEVPDNGSLVDDLTAYLRQVTAMSSQPEMRKLAQALYVASSKDSVAAKAVSEFWRARFQRAFVMLKRAADRGEIASSSDYSRIIEALVAPSWFRIVVIQKPTDEAFIAACVSGAIAHSQLG